MRQILFFSLLALFSMPAMAVYKCESGEKVTYSDAPCRNGKTTDMGNQARQSSASDIAKAEQQNEREKQQLKQLENARHKREAKEEKEQQRLAKNLQAKKKKCQALEQKHRWSKEDLDRASAKKLDSARRRERRLAEKYALECGK
jgi:hypothetical protein